MARDVKIAIVGDASSFSRSVTTAKSDLDGLGKTVADKQSKLSKYGRTAGLALGGLATGAVAFGGSSVKAFAEAEEQQAKLNAAFEKFPQLANGNIDTLRALNEELAKKTVYDDDATASGQAVLAQFGLTAQEIAKVTPLLQDYASKTGKDLPSAAKDLGKAVKGQGKALKNVGVDFKDAGSKAKNFDQLVAGLDSTVGGAAETMGGTAKGKAAILENQFGELQETVGSKLVPILLSLTDKLIALGSWFSEHKPVLVAVATVIGTGLVAAFTAWAISATAAAAATIAAAAPVLAVAAAIALLVAGVVWAYQNWDLFRTAVDKVGDFFQNVLWPLLKSVAAWFTGTLIPTIQAVANKFLDAIGFIRRNWQTILAILTGPIGIAVKIISDNKDKIVGFFKAIPGAIAGFFSGLANTIASPFTTAFSRIKNYWNSTVAGFGFSVPSWVPGVGGKSFKIPTMHTGGIFNPGASEGLALLKRGEGVFTPDQMRALGSMRGAAPQVAFPSHVTLVVDGQQFAARIVADGTVRGGRRGFAA